MTEGQKFDQDDWNEVVSLAFVVARWLYENTRIEQTPDTKQIHFQPTKSKKNKKGTSQKWLDSSWQDHASVLDTTLNC